MRRAFDADAGGLAELLEALPELVVVVDADEVIRYINRVEDRYERSEVIGAPAAPYLQPDSVETFRTALARVLAGKPEETFDVVTRDPEGSKEWYRSRMLPLTRDEAGRVTTVLIVATNVTELKEARETLSRLRVLVPMCAWCDRIRDNEGAWLSLEQYVEASGARVTHGLCPDCARRQMGELDEDEGGGGEDGRAEGDAA